jgi:hypothetical protein
VKGAKAHLPSTLWNQAVELCKDTPISLVARSVSVSEARLRFRVKEAQVGRCNEPAFFEVNPSMNAGEAAFGNRTPSSRGNAVEIERSDGGKLRVQDLESHGVSLFDFVVQFMSGQS